MPVINGVYTKDFPALGRAPIDTDIIPIAEVANQITYKTTIGEIFNAKVFGTTGRLSKFTGANTLGNSILNEIGNAIHLTNAGSSFASFGIINPGTPGDPGVDNDGYIGSTINNDFTIRVNNTEAARFDTALRFKIANIQNATTDTDKFLVSDGGIVKYRTGTELRSDIGAGVGSVTSVGLTMPVAFAVANSPITGAGTLAVTAVGTASQYIRGDGQLADFPTTGGGGSSVAYYLNGSVNQGTFVGNTYYEMNKTPVIGAGTDFTIGADGYIAQFITDANDPSSLLIPAGNWNVEMYFSASSSGGTPSFYVEVYKYNGTTFTLLGSSATTPEGITNGTAIDIYYTSVGIPETVLAITDRLAIRVYVTHSGRTITLHTEDNHLSEIVTTFSNGLTALNGLTKQAQYFATGTTGTDFNISSVTDTHTFNIPDASATARGLITTSAQTITGSKTFESSLYIKQRTGAFVVPPTGYSFIGSSASGFWFANKSATPTFQSVEFDLSSITDATVRTYIMPNANGTLALVGGVGVGTVTSVAALTLGTSGTDLNSSVANSTTTPVITLNVPTASATNRGALSSANWTTFNNKQDALSGTGIVKSTAGVISYLTDPLPIANGGTGSATQNFVDLTNNQTIAGTKTFTTASRTIFTNSDFFQVEFSNGSSKLNLGSATGESFIYSSGDLRFGTNYPTDSLSSPKLIIATSGLVTITNQLRLNSTITNGTYTYTLPSATGTLALTSALSAYLPLAGGTLTGALNGTSATFSGNVTINSAATSGKLNIQTANDNGLYIYNGSSASRFMFNNYFGFGIDSMFLQEWNTSNVFQRNVMTFFTGGNVGVGTSGTDAGYKLDVNGTGRFSSDVIATTGLQINNSTLNTPRYINFAANNSVDNDYGGLRFYNFQWDSLIKAEIVSATDGALSKGKLVFKTSNGGVNAIERMRINSNGEATFSSSVSSTEYRLSNLSTLLQVSSYTVLRDNNERNAILIGNSDAPANYYDNSEHYFRNRTGATQYLTIATTGAATFSSSVSAKGLYIATGQFTQSGSATSTFYTFDNLASNRVFMITVRQSGNGPNNVTAMSYTYGSSLMAYNLGQDNTNPVLYLTVSYSGLGVTLTTGSGYGSTTWEYTITQIK